jgi:hypothetical protein
MRDPEKAKRDREKARQKYRSDPKTRAAVKAAQDRYRLKNRRKIADYSKFRKMGIELGISPKECVQVYHDLFLKQNGLCAICHLPERVLSKNGTPRPLSLDHNHKSKRVRALLCSVCNSGIGFFKEDPALLRNAAAYLELFDRDLDSR